MILLADTVQEVWVANILSSIVTGGVIIAIIGYFLKRYVAQQDATAKELARCQVDLAEKLALSQVVLAEKLASKHLLFENHIKDMVDCSDGRSDKIEKNYLTRFDEVKKEINTSKDSLQRELTQEIREITKNKHSADIEQTKAFAEIKTDVKIIAESFNEFKKHTK